MTLVDGRRDSSARGRCRAPRTPAKAVASLLTIRARDFAIKKIDKDCQIFHSAFVQRHLRKRRDDIERPLSEEIKRWEEAQGRSGRFGNSSHSVRELIRREQERQVKIAHVQKLIDKGIHRGISEMGMADVRGSARSKTRT